MPRGRGRVALVIGATLAVLYVIGLASGDDSGDSATVAGTVVEAPTTLVTTTIAPPTSVVATRAPVSLPTALSRTTAAGDGTGIFVAGGRSAQKTSVNTVLRFDPATSTFTPAGTLGEILHDAAAIAVPDGVRVLGGGDAKSTASVHALAAGKATVLGKLPEPRADLTAAVIEGTVYVVGGFDGAKEPTSVLASSDGGATFHQLGTLLHGNRYGTLVAVGKMLYLIGGEENGTQVAKVLRIDPADGSVAQIGSLPAPLSGAAGFVLDRSVFVAGGRSGTAATDQILRLDLDTGVASRAGTLPEAVANASVAVVGDSAWLFGGESTTAVATVVQIRAAS